MGICPSLFKYFDGIQETRDMNNRDMETRDIEKGNMDNKNMDYNGIPEKDRIHRVDRKLAYKGSLMRIYDDTMELPDGRISHWDFFDHKGGAAVVPVLEDGRILMVRQFRNALDRDSLEIPAGAFDQQDEDPMLCAARELEEETGYQSGSMEYLLTMDSMPAFTNEQVTIYLAKDLKPASMHLDDEEFLSVERWALEDLLHMISSGKLSDSKTVCGILAYALRLKL